MRTRQFIASVLAGLVLILGGVGLTAAPAQATGSYVEFNQGVGSGAHGFVTIYRPSGVYSLPNGSWADQVWKVCPIGYDRIKWVSSSGASGLKNNAVCFFPQPGYSYGIGTRAP